MLPLNSLVIACSKFHGPRTGEGPGSSSASVTARFSAPPSSFDEARGRFMSAYPAFASTGKLDDLRARDYGRLDRQGHTYLDYTGAGLPAESLLRDHHAFLADRVLGNPHSNNLTSTATTVLVERTRNRVLAFFNAAPDEYEVIFTPNATGAVKLVGESYPFAPGGVLALTFDNHNSVNGIREFARARGADIAYIPLSSPDLRVDDAWLGTTLGGARAGTDNLFAYPAQSNFSGVQHPLAWIAEAQAQGWDVLLDAASFVPTHQLDLARWHPDFVDVSFYKMFGYPTGAGCLLARKQALRKLRRPWFAGGTISFSSVGGDGHFLTPGGAGFEDGTGNFLSLPAVELGLDYLEAAGVDTIRTRVMSLTGWLLDQVCRLRHTNGAPAIRLYGPRDTSGRGATIELNVVDPSGDLWDCRAVEKLASAQGISLRAGCHCNPGAREVALGFDAQEMRSCFEGKDHLSLEEFMGAIEGKTTGAVRVSLGLVTTFADVYRFMRFASTFVDRHPPSDAAVHRASNRP